MDFSAFGKQRAVLACGAAALTITTPVPSFAQSRSETPAASSIDALDISRAQAQRLELLIKVWGFAKYHHPLGTDETFDWDAEFLRIAPRLGEADANTVLILTEWLDGLGPVADCNPCASLPDEMTVAPPTPAWLESGRLPGALQQRLAHIYKNRPLSGPTAQVRPVENIGNPTFPNEKGYDTGQPISAPERLLALARYWNILRYWFPYRELMSRDTDALLTQYVPVFLGSDSANGYVDAVARFAREVEDGHSSIGKYVIRGLRPSGNCTLPVRVRYLGGRVVVDHQYASPDDTRGGAILPGDVITSIDGTPVEAIRDRFRPYLPASTLAVENLRVTRFMLWGDCGETEADIVRAGTAMTVTADRVAMHSFQGGTIAFRDRAGNNFQVLDGNIAYLKVTGNTFAEVEEYLQRASEMQGLIIDLRSYPSGDFTLYAIASWLTHDRPDFARFTNMDMTTPGTIKWVEKISLPPHEEGKLLGKPVVALIDEVSASSSEFHAMAFRAAGATLIGSPTAGADGNISTFALPRGGEAVFTGIGVFYPDGTPTQRVGILPDIHIRPTAAGIAAGRDEVLERGMAEIIAQSAD